LAYKILFAEKVEKDLKKVDKAIARDILNKADTFLSKDPHKYGRKLKGLFKGLWRYRIGDYRVLYRIEDNKVLVIVLRIGHRRNIYK